MNTFCSALTRHDFGTGPAPAQAAHRGAYRLPFTAQQLGRDLAGEGYAGGSRTYRVLATTPEWRNRTATPYLYLVQAPSCSAHTAFSTAAELLDWCCAYAVTLKASPHHLFVTFTAEIGDPAHWLPLT